MKDQSTGFDLLKLILESAATGRSQRDLTSTESANFKAVFDDLEGECRIARASLEGDVSPLVHFRSWLPHSGFKDYSLEKTVAELQEAYRKIPRAEALPWIPFRAPLAFIRAVDQYNRDQGTAPSTVPSAKHYIQGINGLVVLMEAIAEHFPFPRIIRNVGSSTYLTKSCSIRIGVRPPRGDMRRCLNTTVVVGQLAGNSAVTLVPPRLQSLHGLSLEYHEKVRPTWENRVTDSPHAPPSFAIANKVWTGELQRELIASKDFYIGTLTPGSALLVPKGWYYGVRSINKKLELNASVTWFLHRSEAAVEDQENTIRSLI